MASDAVHTGEFQLKELAVKTVTLGPKQNTVVCEIADVPIKPGPNEITIFGLDPDVDQNSIRVTGPGRSTIRDIQVSILSVVGQPERFEDVFPDDDDSEGDETIDEEDPDDNFGADKPGLNKSLDAIAALQKKNRLCAV